MGAQLAGGKVEGIGGSFGGQGVAVGAQNLGAAGPAERKQQGNRKGPWSALMKNAVAKMTIDDMIAVAAFTASREP